MTTNHCGSCTACCRVFAIPQLSKPAGNWCHHCDIGVGCKIYERRPTTCQEFECLWLQARSRDDIRDHLPEELRPDRSKVVFHPTTDPEVMSATTMPGSPDAWKRKPVKKLIDRMVAAGYRVAVGGPASETRMLFTSTGMVVHRMTKPDENGMQWNIPEEGE
jgi:hypothetical protein